MALQEISDYELVWYGDNRVITWGPYQTEVGALEAVKRSEAPLQRWRLVRKVYVCRLDRLETIQEGLASEITTAPHSTESERS